MLQKSAGTLDHVTAKTAPRSALLQLSSNFSVTQTITIPIFRGSEILLSDVSFFHVFLVVVQGCYRVITRGLAFRYLLIARKSTLATSLRLNTNHPFQWVL